MCTMCENVNSAPGYNCKLGQGNVPRYIGIHGKNGTPSDKIPHGQQNHENNDSIIQHINNIHQKPTSSENTVAFRKYTSVQSVVKSASIFLFLAFISNSCAYELCHQDSFVNTTIYVSKSYFSPLKEKLITGCLNNATLGIQQAMRINCKEENIHQLKHGAIRNLPNLKYLIFSHNNLSLIYPEAISNLSSLEIFNVIHNELEVILKYNFKNLPMKIFNLEHNKITYIQSNGLGNLTKLEMLTLTHNHLKRWDQTYLGETSPNLQNLDLSFNLLTYLAPDSFVFHPKLEILNLASNRLCNLDPLSLRGDFLLHWLDLKHNFLTQMHPDLIIGRYWGPNQTKSLSLELTGNRLTHLPVKFLVNLSGVVELFLAGNPMTCACLDMVKLWATTKSINVDCIEEVKFCVQPRHTLQKECEEIFDYRVVEDFHARKHKDFSHKCSFNPDHHRSFQRTECNCQV